MADELQSVAHVGAIHGDIWAIEHTRMRAYLGTFVAEGILSMDPDAMETRCCPRKVEHYSLAGEPVAAPSGQPQQSLVGVLPLVGPITHRETPFSAFFSGTSLQKWERAFAEMVANPAIGAIVLDVDSPGGQVSGVAEVADRIRAGNRVKPVVAVANAWTASAAYYLASQAGEIVVTPSGEIGSVGVYSLHLDYSEALKRMGIKATFIFSGNHKVDGNPYEPLSEEAREYEQAIVDDYYQEFVEAVAKGRNTTPGTVKRDYGGGRMLRPAKAVEVGMADRVGTLESAIRGVAGRLREESRKRAQCEALKREMEILRYECQ
jgi:signal peptide peptidase SppA